MRKDVISSLKIGDESAAPIFCEIQRLRKKLFDEKLRCGLFVQNSVGLLREVISRKRINFFNSPYYNIILIPRYGTLQKPFRKGSFYIIENI